MSTNGVHEVSPREDANLTELVLEEALVSNISC